MISSSRAAGTIGTESPVASKRWRFRSLVFLCDWVARGRALSSIAGSSINANGGGASKPIRPPLTHTELSFDLAPMLGRNDEFRSDASDVASIDGGRLDSVIWSSKRSKRVDFDSDAQVHILRSCPDLWGSWCPTKAVDAAERHDLWTTGRHHLYPTTDVPAGDLPDGMGEAALDLAARVILPSIAFAFDAPLGGLHFKDLFLARYEPSGQPGLGRHTDGSAYSFNMLLSDPTADFDGGGTWIEPVGLVRPGRGDVLIHRGDLPHEGRPVSGGVRHVLVGFVQSDDDDGRAMVHPNGESELLLKTMDDFPLGMVVEVDGGDKTSCAAVADVAENGSASRAGIRRGDCIRGMLLPKKFPWADCEFVRFDGEDFDAVMEKIVARKGRGSVKMVVERWCSA